VFRDTIRTWSNGLLVEPGDPQALADALSRLALEPGLLAELSATAARMDLQTFEWPLIADATVAIYELAAARWARGQAGAHHGGPSAPSQPHAGWLW
jgi:glycosyltransferase involved in cell wall biosynthesis